MSIDKSKVEQIQNVLGNSISQAMDTLSAILGSKLSTECGNLIEKSVNGTDLTALAPSMYYNIVFSGDVQGEAVAVFREVDLSIILKLLMNSDNDEVEFDEMGLGMIKEIMTQFSNALSEKIGSYYGLDVTCSISAIMNYTDHSIITNAFDCTETSTVYNMSIQYAVGTILKGKAAFCFSSGFIKTLGNFSGQTSRNANDGKGNSPAQSLSSGRAQQNVNVAEPVFPRFDNGSSDTGELMNNNMDLLMEVPMNVCVEIGKTKKKMKEIMNFTQGTVIPIDKQAGAPVDITVNGQLIARGDVIVIDDNFGVRITELVNSKGTDNK